MEAAKTLEASPSPSGRGGREAAGEGRKSLQILRPSPCPLPEGEVNLPQLSIFSQLPMTAPTEAFSPRLQQTRRRTESFLYSVLDKRGGRGFPSLRLHFRESDRLDG